MEKTVKISILRRKREFKIEKRVKISILGRKREFKIEKRVKISILGRKKEFKIEKRVKISILELGGVPLVSTISYNRKPPIWTRVIRKS
ncbi:hypothetical protein [Gemella haemolysans]|uniref:hypothetical protein n=1 Tax=Gemella haemolysans TaxID=1379 RepID=UPI0028D0C216|nr:hypothetical protein [Gemella haemolysans]